MSRPKKQKCFATGRQRLNAPSKQRPFFDIEQALAKAIQYHQAGDLQRAEKIYIKILSINPNHAETLHAQAIIACRRGQYVAATDLFQKAIREDPANPAYHFNLGNAFKDLGRFAEAAPCYGEALRLKPDYCEALNNLGTALLAQDKFAEAVASYQRALRIKPDYLEALNNLGIIFHSQGKFDEALSSYQKVLQLKPDHSGALYNLANTLQSQGLTQEAILYYQKALKTKGDFPEVYNRLGIIFCEQGKPEAAIGCFQYALQIDPTSAEYYSNLAKALTEQGELDKAIVCHQKVIELAPSSAIAYNNLGGALTDRGRFPEAEAYLRQALELQPNLAEAYCNLGNLQQEQGRFAEAEASYGQALALMPDYAEISEKLGNTLKRQGRLTEAEAYLRRALELKPNHAKTCSNLAVILFDQGRIAEAEVYYRQALALKPDYANGFSNLLFCLSQNEKLDAEILFSEHCRFGEQFETPFRTNYPPHTNSRNPERSLRVGFVSADLRNHAVTNFIEPVLTHLSNYSQLSLHAYSSHAIEDAVTQRIRAHFAHWHSVMGLSDAALAEKIRAAGIDILIDLSGHTAKNRLLTFARKPAPVQASWMGYPGTTGMSAIDYYLADRFLLPLAQLGDQFTEKIVHLPANAPFLPNKNAPPVNTLPALRNGYITFGSFNRPSKLTPSVISIWSQILRILPNSQMLLGSIPQDETMAALIDLFAQEGIARERLTFYPRCDMDSYLRLHQQVDLCLDSFPYNGGTTTCHALWMGIPTLTLTGNTMPGRVGAALLDHVGLENFIATSKDDFVQKGIALAMNLSALANLRTGLRERFRQSVPGQPELIAAGLERALRIMWQRWCAELPPESFEVTLQDISSPTQEAKT